MIDRSRAWQYMGAEPVVFGLRMLYRGDLYIARHPWTPGDGRDAKQPPGHRTGGLFRMWRGPDRQGSGP